MKRKIFSKLLMVALVIAAVGSFVSCKDYDDDINNLQKQIDAKAAISELTALQSTLESKIASAQSAATAAQAKADAAATKTSVDELKKALETAIADAKKAGTDAGTKAGEAITAANKAQETADAAAAAAKKADEDAKAALADALKTIEETYQTKADAEKAVAGLSEAIAAVKETADAAFTKAEAEKLQEQVDGLKAELEAAIDEKIDAKIQEVNNAVASVDAIWKAVTSVELWASHTGTVYSKNYNLLLLTGEQVDDVFGGTDNTKSSDLQVAYQDGNELTGEGAITYTAGKEIDFTNRIIVRVNPANAEVKPEDIVLINSLGDETLNNLVEVTKVEDYKQLITRAGVETGLKVVTIVRKDNVTDDAIAAATEGKKIKAADRPTSEEGQAAFALGIKSGEENRVAYSTFDLFVEYGDYEPVDELDFFVKGDAADKNYKNIATLKNRWNNTDKKLIGEDETAETPKEPYKDSDWYPEFVWNTGSTKAAVLATIPSVDTLWVGKDKNFAIGDGREGLDNYIVVDDETRTFTIDLNPYSAAVPGYLIPGNSHVQYYYVTLDKFAAVESAPSEYQAWKKYEYDGLFKMTPAIDPLKVTIKSEAAVGDIIGFRVFAVNFDGTLVDPDGRSFYVQVGTPAAADTPVIEAHFVATKAHGATALTDFNAAHEPLWVAANSAAFLPATTDAALLAAAKTTPTTLNATITAVDLSSYKDGVVANADLSGQVDVEELSDAAGYDKAIFTGATPTAWYQLLDKNKNPFPATATVKLSQIKYVAAALDYSLAMADGYTVMLDKTIEVIDPDHHDKVVSRVSITLTKDMPTEPGTNFSWKYTLGPDADGNLDIYPDPAIGGAAVTWATDNSTVTQGIFDLTKIANNLVADAAGNTYTLYASYKPGTTERKVFNNVVATAPIAKAFTWDNNYDNDGAYIFDKKYAAKLNFNWNRISMTKKNKAFVTDATEAYAKQVAVGGLTSITLKDAAAPGNQTYAITPYNYAYRASAGVPTTTPVSGATEYFLDYNAGHWYTADNTTSTATNLLKHASYDASFTTDGAAASDANRIYGDNTAAIVNTLAGGVITGTNIVSFISSNGGVNFNGNFQSTVYGNATGHFALVTGADAAITPGDMTPFRAKLISGGNTEYYNVAITPAGALTFYKNTSDAPAYTHEARLKVWAVDAFSRGAKRPIGAGVSANTGDENGTPIIDIPVTIYVK